MPEAFDLVVVGGGPAGSTLAGLVKKHDPAARVLLLEKAAFPRHHIGESLLPGMIPVLKELGVWERLNSAGFPRKFGVVFVWGNDRKPWDADFNNLNLEMLEKHGRLLDTEFSWQVRRSEYDAILLDHAKGLGVEVRHGWKALEPVEKDGTIVGVSIEGPDGRREELACRTLADCSGQNGFLAPLRRTRKWRDDLKNVAAYAYFKGAKWKFEYQGHPDKTKIFVCSVPEGWFWYIPLSRDEVSVGLVSKADYVKRKGVKDMRAFFFDALSRCREIAPLVKSAAVMKGQDPADPGKDFFTAGDWSFVNDRACGPGWVAAGDAAFFIDPLLSSGVMMAHLSGHRAAYTLLAARREKDPALSRLLWKDYDRFCKEVSESFLTLVQYWYAHDPNAERWWKEAKGALQKTSPLDLSDKMSFVAVAAGMTYTFERAYTQHSMVFGASGAQHSWQWEGTKHELRRWTRQILAIVETGFLKKGKRGPAVRLAEARVRWKAVPDAWVPRWTLPRTLSTAFVPVAGEGSLRPVTRLELRRGKKPTAADPRRLLPPSLALLARLLDGRRSVGELKRLLRARTELPSDLLDGQVFRFLKDLAVLGAIDFKKGARAGARARAESPFRDGESALREGRPAAAEPLLDKAVSAGRGGAWALALRGEARRHLGRLDDSLADLDAALAALERTSLLERAALEDRLRLLRAKARLAAGEHAAAKEDADAALKANARQSEALIVRAKARTQLKDLAGAKADLEAALAIEAGDKGQG